VTRAGKSRGGLRTQPCAHPPLPLIIIWCFNLSSYGMRSFSVPILVGRAGVTHEEGIVQNWKRFVVWMESL